MTQFEVTVVPDSEWTKRPGRTPTAVPEAIKDMVKAGLRDGKKRGVVIPNEDVDELKKNLRKASVELNCTVTTQVHPVEATPGYSKFLFKVGDRITRTRK